MNSMPRFGTMFLAACSLGPLSSVATAQRFGGELIASGGRTYDVLPADVTGDGIVDIVLVEPLQVRTLIGDGAGGYSIGPSSWWNIPMLYAERGQIAFFNSDSEPDLVLTIANHGQSIVRHVVMLGLGGGAFQALPGGELGCDETKLEVADLDHDGDVDVVVASECPLSVYTLMNHGNGVITKFTYPSLGGHSAHVADFNGDGEWDVALGGFTPARSVVVHFGTAGVFGPPTKYGLVNASVDLAVGDVDGDGDSDVVALIVGPNFKKQLVTLHNDGTGVFAATYGELDTWERLTLADMDADGALDVVAVGPTSASCYIARNLGQGLFAPAREWGSAPSYFAPPRVFDLDSDGHLDVLIGCEDGVAWLRGLGMSTLDSGEFQGSGLSYDGVAADLDGDGTEEIVTVRSTGVRVMQNSGFGAFEPGPTTSIPFVPDYRGARVQVGDVDGDGQLDAVVNAVSIVVWARGDGLGGFAPAVSIDTNLTGVSSGFGELVAVGDIDGDGIDDIAATHFSLPGEFVWLRSLGNGSFAAPSGVPFTGYAKGIRLADLDHDGRADVLVRGNTFVRVMLSQTGGGFGPLTDYTLPSSIADMQTGYVDGDAHLDLVVATGGSGGAIVTYFGDGLGNFGTPITSVAGFVSPLTLTDFDQDGSIDIVGNRLASFSWLKGDGAGLFTGQGVWALAASGASGLITDDVNGDGAIDIVATSKFIVKLQLTDGVQPGSYCTPKVNSLGCTPRMRTTGTSSSFAASGFIVTAEDVINDRTGLCFYGFNGTNAGAFQGGTLCVRAPLWRSAPTNSGGNAPPAHDCSGSWSIDFNTLTAGLGGGSPANALSIPGTHVFCQWWGRDGGFAPASNVQLSDALHFVVQP